MYKKHLSFLKEKNLLRSLMTVESVEGVRAVINGRPCTLFCTNDYLGLAGHPMVKAAASEAIEEFGFGAGSAPLIAGHTAYHERLGRELASFKGTERTLLFGSGYLANAGLLPALAGDGDVIISDELNHASVIDGCRLSRAEVVIYDHADVTSLEGRLIEGSSYEHRFIVTEGVFGMDGDVAPMPEIAALAKKYDATVILDEAHATGVIGDTGRGTLEHFGLPAGEIIQMGTLGKALGSYGAFVAGPADVVDYLANCARSFMFSTALPPGACAAASAALRVVREEPERRALLLRNEDALRATLKEAGFEVLGGGTPIAPMVIGDAGEAAGLAASLLSAGFYAPAIRPPTVPEGGSRIRFTASASHELSDIDALAAALKGLSQV